MADQLTIRGLENSEELDSTIARWQHFPPASLSQHGRDCCELARQWLLMMDYSQLGGANRLAGPRWMSEKYKWGPSLWPLHWCEAVRKKMLDCRAAAALARELFTARELISFPAQLIQEFSEEATKQWCTRWQNHLAPTQWIAGRLIYHEGCAVVTRDQEIQIWDASQGCWLDPHQCKGYGAVVAIRLTAFAQDTSSCWRWGPHHIPSDEWYRTETDVDLGGNDSHTAYLDSSGQQNVTRACR